MLNIDLLKGRGIPIKSRPRGAVLLAFIIALPITVMIVVFGNYMRGSILLTTQKQSLDNVGASISRLIGTVRSQNTFENEIVEINAYLKDVAYATEQNFQWSGILESLAESMPDKLVLFELDVENRFKSKKAASRKDPSRIIVVHVPKKVLHITVYRKISEGSDEVVLDFLRVLGQPEVFGEKVDSIRLVSRKVDEKRERIYYEIECIFKS